MGQHGQIVTSLAHDAKESHFESFDPKVSDSKDKSINAHVDRSTTEQSLIRSRDDEIDDIICLTDQFNRLRSKYKETRSIDDLDKAITAINDIFNFPINDISRASWLDDLGRALLERFKRTRLADNLDDAITNLENALNCFLITTDHRADYLEDLGEALNKRFQQRKIIQDLDRAINIMKESSTLTENDYDRADRLHILGNLLQDRYEAVKSLHDLNEAIHTYGIALKWIGNMERSALLEVLGNALEKRFEIDRDLNDLKKLVEVRREAVERLANGYYDIGVYSNNLSIALQDIFEWTASLDDLAEAIVASENAVRFAADEEDRALYLYNLGRALQSKAGYTGRIADIEAAVKTSGEAVETAGVDHPKRSKFLDSYGHALEARFERLGNIDDINRAVRAYEAAVEAPGLCRCSLNNLSDALLRRFSRLDSVADLDRAFAISAEVDSHDMEGKLDRTRYLHTLANIFLSRFERLQCIEDLEQALETARAATDCKSESPLIRAMYLKTFGYALLAKSERNASMDDLNQAVETIREAVTITNQHSDQIQYLTDLGNALQKRFERYGSIDDLNAIVKLRKQVVDATEEDDPRVSGHFTNLGNALELRYEMTGSIEYLNEAIRANQKAVQFQDDNLVNRAMCSYNLGRCLEARSDRMGSLSDLNSAIIAKQYAVHAISIDHPKRAMYLTALSISLRHRSFYTKSIEDLNNAVNINIEALNSTSESDPARAVRAFNLGSCLHQRAILTSSLTDLNEAVLRLQEAIESTSANHMYRQRWLSNLGDCFMHRYHGTGSKKDLEDAIQNCDKAIDVIPKGHPDRAACLLQSARARVHRIKLVGSVDSHDRQNVVAAAEQAVAERGAPAHVRIAAAIMAADLFETDPPNIERASHFLRMAVGFLPEISSRTLTRNDQQRTIAGFSGLTSRAAAYVLDSEGALEALRLLEIGRGVLASLQLETRTDVSDLEEAHPDLAREFKSLQDELDLELNFDNDVTEWNEAVRIAAQTTRRHDSVQRMASIMQEIRSLKSFERFLLGPSKAELLTLASKGPIVVFNVAPSRSDALLITSDSIRCLPLPAFHQKDIISKSQTFITMLDRLKLATYNITTKFLKKLLEWLWDVAVGPVLDELKITGPPREGAAWPKVWWVASGWLNLLPLHAAGYLCDTTRNAMDRVISCYVPTLKALSYSRKRVALLSPTQSPEILFVSMPRTPGHHDLPHVVHEIAALDRILPVSSPRTILTTPNKKDVEENIRSSQIVHFACHGKSDLVNPSQSHLLLSDCQSDTFAVTDITALKLTEPLLAYLSACYAANIRVEGLLDESIHIASACQLAGFSHVIGTLWTINDCHSVRVSKDVYTFMVNDKDEVDVGKAAEGLHSAIRRLRAATVEDSIFQRKLLEDPLVWVSYIYLGA